jgi:hypothetical protein
MLSLVRIPTGTQSKKILLYTKSNIIFPRISKITMENTRPANQQISITNLTFNDQQRSHLLNISMIFVLLELHASSSSLNLEDGERVNPK